MISFYLAIFFLEFLQILTMSIDVSRNENLAASDSLAMDYEQCEWQTLNEDQRRVALEFSPPILDDGMIEEFHSCLAEKVDEDGPDFNLGN